MPNQMYWARAAARRARAAAETNPSSSNCSAADFAEHAVRGAEEAESRGRLWEIDAWVEMAERYASRAEPSRADLI